MANPGKENPKTGAQVGSKESAQKKADERKLETIECNKVQISEETAALHNIIGSLVLQYLHLFEKAKIYEVKKSKGLQKQIMNYVNGHVKKL